MVDIAGRLDTKFTAIGCYQSQFPLEKADVYPRVGTLAVKIGAGSLSFHAAGQAAIAAVPLSEWTKDGVKAGKARAQS